MQRPPVAYALVAILTAYLLASALSFWPYTVDDAFISLRYAQNLTEHGELVWNLGERVEGISNPLWTLWLALGLFSGIAVVPWMKCTGLVAGLLLVPGTFALARRVTGSLLVATMAAAIVATNASVALWSIAGLETTSFALLLLLFALRFEGEMKARERGESLVPISALLFALAWFSRPEAPAYALYPLVRRFFGGPRVSFARVDVTWCLVAGLPILSYELFGLVYFGGLLPATHAAKVGDGPALIESLSTGRVSAFLGWRYLTAQGPLFAVFAVASLVGAVAAIRRLPPAAWAMATAGMVFVAYAFFDWMPRYRFFVPPLPFLAIVQAIGIAALVARAPARLVGPACAVLVGLGAFDQATRGYDRQHSAPLAVDARGAWWTQLPERLAQRWSPGRQELDAWFVLRALPADEWVVCPDIGFIGALTANPLWDVRGLVTPPAAAYLSVADDDPRLDAVSRAMLDDLFEKRPGYLLLPRRPQGMARVVRRFAEAFRADPRSQERYEEIPPFIDSRLVWRRRDLPDAVPDLDRLEAALGRLPSYDTPMKRKFVGE